MLRSMTGFANISEQIETSDKSGNSASVQISLEAKSVNSRYFEASVKLPQALSVFETKISSMAKQKLGRGRLFMSISMSSGSFSFEQVVFSASMAEQYASAVQTISDKFCFEGKVSATDLLRLPGVITLEKAELGKDVEDKILSLAEKLLDRLNESRGHEGDQLKADIQGRANACSQAIEKIQARNIVVVDELKKVVSQLEASMPDEPDETLKDQIRDASHKLDKADVSEEIVRFTSHLESLEKVLASDSAEKGKRLDFLCQELFRETNTICSKSHDLETVGFAVETKVELEKIKEQAQNVV